MEINCDLKSQPTNGNEVNQIDVDDRCDQALTNSGVNAGHIGKLRKFVFS